MWFDFTTKGKKIYINTDALLCVTEMADNKTEFSFANGGGAVVDVPINEVERKIFQSVEDEEDV